MHQVDDRRFRTMSPHTKGRITIVPEWAKLLDFVTRVPSAFEG